MESIPIPRPPTVTTGSLPKNAGVNFQYKLLTGTVYWAMRFVDHNEELREEFSGAIPLWDTKSISKLGRVIKSFSADMKLPLRMAGGTSKYELFGLSGTTGALAPTYAETNALDAAVEEELKNTYSDVVIYTDASWNRTALISKVGTGWCARIGSNGTFGTQVYTGIHARYAERYALIEGLKNTYHDVYKTSGVDGKITLRTDMLYVAEWATALFAGKATLAFKDLPDNTLYYFLKKCLDKTISGNGPTIVIEWVKGHSGNVWNDYADRLAVLSRRSSDVGPITNKAWGKLNQDFIQSLKDDRSRVSS